jgi:hypothetical protein
MLLISPTETRMADQFVRNREQLVAVVARCPVSLLSGMRPSSLLGPLFSPRFNPLIPSFETNSREGPFRRQGKAVASHKSAAL